MGKSNQGQELDQLLADVSQASLQVAADAIWRELKHHPDDATCQCPALEGLAALYELGYRLTLEPRP